VPNGEVGKAELRLPDLERGADAIPVVAKQPAPAPSTVTAGTASEIERLKSDPSVLIQVVPSDPYTGRAAAKTQTAKAPAKTPGAADGLSGAAALRPALSDWDWRLPSGVHH
jgi:hypothetical protein